MLTGDKATHTKVLHFHNGDASASRRSEREFERLYKESFPLVYGYVRSRMSSVADTEDIVSEAYLKATRAFDSFDPSRARFSTWVITIAKNCMISHWRKVHPTLSEDEVSFAEFSVGDESGNVDNTMFVQQLLTCLNDEERELIALKYRDGLRNVDIAEELGMNASTVSTKLANAIAKMREHIERDD